jgi:alanyl-tRNA synthetase
MDNVKAYDELDVFEGDRIGIVVEKTPFFPKSGGQESDKGTIQANGFWIDVDEVTELVPGVIVHWGTVHIENRKE